MSSHICRGLLAMVALFYCLITNAQHPKTRGHLSQQREALLSHPATNHQDHPNLYFSPEDVPRLRTLVNTSHAGLYKKLIQIVRAIGSGNTPPYQWENFSAKWNEVYGNSLAVLATYCVLTPDDRQALDVAKRFMDRFARLPNWRVRGKEVDDVPVAHNLLGFVTALDFLYASFTSVERSRYLAKARETCEELYTSSAKKWWGRSSIHNHVATNYVALFTAALVLKRHYPEHALRWQQRSKFVLNKTLTLLRLVVDGSLNEGVSYGSYTMRSLTQFMYLAERHFHYSYRHNNWLRHHFDFMLHSILPGYQKTIGIADSVNHWAYGPESQLTFLETYVRRDGKAIWLANQIRTMRPARRMKNLLSTTHSTLHTEFLFYNDSLKETASTDEARLHVFTDWGVITYGGGTPAGNVFLSFKCGRLHGRALNMLRSNLTSKQRRWFSPGHEHTDHGSFVFIAKEQPVITESFYTPKFTFLDNVLLFGYSRKLSCSSPYQGQLGECGMWFNHRDDRTWQAHGELVGYSRHGDVIFMSGDMTGWYDPSLGLQSVGRALIMLTPSILVVVDTIRLRTASPTTHVSAFFHNDELPFEKKISHAGGRSCAMVGRYSMCWAHHNSQTVNVTTRSNFTVERARKTTNFINVTSRCAAGRSLWSTAYIFHGPDNVLHDAAVIQTPSKGDGITVNVKMNSNEYDITLSARYENPRLRRILLGTSGYGTLRVNKNMLINLGLKTARSYDTTRYDTRTSAIKRDQPFGYLPTAFALTSFVALVCLFLYLKRRLRSHFYIRWTMFWLTTFFLCFSIKFIILRLPGSLPPGFSPSAKDTPWRSARAKSSGTRLPRQLDTVVAMGLPLNGAEIARELFTTNTDFVVVDVPSRNVVTPSDVLLLKENLDLCEWRENDNSHVASRTGINMNGFVKWWREILSTPWKIRKNKNKEYISLSNPLVPGSKHGTEVIKSEGALAFVHFRNPGWLFRVSWLNAIFLGNSSTPVLYVVRDPRSWIEHMLSLNNSLKSTFFQQLDRALRKDDHCEFSSEILGFREDYDVNTKPHVVLARIWVAFASYASRLMASLPSSRFRILRFEDLISSPKDTSEDVYDFLRMPFPAAVEHRILQVIMSGVFPLEDYGIIDQRYNTWGKILSSEQVLDVERICGEVMSVIGYNL